MWNALENLWASSRAWTSALPFLSSRIVSLPLMWSDSSLFASAAIGNRPRSPIPSSVLSMADRCVSPPSRRSRSGHSSCLLAHLDTASDIILRSSWASDLTL